MAPLYILRLEGFYSKESGKEIHYSEESTAEMIDVLIFVGFQKYYLGERYSENLLDDIIESLRFNYPQLHWVRGPIIRTAPAHMGLKVSVGFWGQKQKMGYQFLCIVDDGIISKIYVRTILDGII